MTAIKRLSLSEMIKETGIPAAGYANPKKNKIFIVKGLTKEQEKEVLAHEFAHIEKNEEGPFSLGKILSVAAPIAGGIFGGPVGAAIGSGVGSLFAGREQANAQRAAAEAGARAADPFGPNRGPFAQLLQQIYGVEGSTGNTAGAAGGLKIGMVRDGDGQTAASPAGMRTDLFRNLPGYQFSLSEMMRAVTRGASATGGIGSGKMLAELQQRAGGLAEQTYGGEMSRLMTLAGADRGSPGTAGSILSSGMAGAAESRTAGMIGMGNALGYAFGGGGGNQPYSGISGVIRGSQQDTMLAEQNAGLF